MALRRVGVGCPGAEIPPCKPLGNNLPFFLTATGREAAELATPQSNYFQSEVCTQSQRADRTATDQSFLDSSKFPHSYLEPVHSYKTASGTVKNPSQFEMPRLLISLHVHFH